MAISRKAIAKSLFLVLSCLLFFTGCKNFFGNSNLLEDLQDSIDYNNLQQCNVSVFNLDADCGNIIDGEGEHLLRKTESFNIHFITAEGYTFIQWKAVNKNDVTESMENYIQIDNPYSEQTKVTLILENESLMIIPVCVKKLGINSFYPDVQDKEYPKDSSVIIEFNCTIPENDLSQIKIEISGLDNANGYFEEPEIKDKSIYIVAKTDNRIPVEPGELRKVTVTIPKTFVYVSNGIQRSFDKDYTVGYTINSSISETINISFKNEEDINGTFTVNDARATGETETYSVGQAFKLVYKPSISFNFVSFKSSDDESVLLTNETHNIITDSYEATAVLINSKNHETISVYPEVERRNKLYVVVKGNNGRVTPVIESSYYRDDTFIITCTPSDNYAFTTFECSLNGVKFDPSSKDSIISLTTITKENNYAEYEVKVNSVPEENLQLVLEAKNCLRPKIATFLPSYDKTGVPRDRNITIMFDHNMSKQSIYFTNEECIEKIAQGYSLLPTPPENTTVYDEETYYGYVDKEGKTNFKNITITRLDIDKHPDDDFLIHYKEPVFDNDNTKILRIPVTIYQDKLPTASTDIMVTLSKNFFYNDPETNTAVTFKKNYSFSYRTNGEIENLGPVFTKNSNDRTGEFKVCMPPVSNIQESDFTKWTTIAAKSNFQSNELSAINNLSSKIYIHGGFEAENGISKVQWNLYKRDCYNNDFTNIYYSGGNERIKYGTFNLTKINQKFADVDAVLDFSSDNLESDKFYELEIIAYTDLQCSTVKSFYFIKDDVGPQFANLNYCISYFLDKTSQAKIKLEEKMDFSIGKTYDLQKFEIQKDDEEKRIYTINDLKNGYTHQYSLSNISDITKIKITAYDYLNNVSEYVYDYRLGSGFILYSDGSFANYYLRGKKPVAIVLYVDGEAQRIKVIDYYNKGAASSDVFATGWIDNNQCDFDRMRVDGYYNTYELAFDKCKQWCIAPGLRTPWTTLKKKIESDEENPLHLEWYLPAIEEYRDCFNYEYLVDPAFDIIHNEYLHTTNWKWHIYNYGSHYQMDPDPYLTTSTVYPKEGNYTQQFAELKDWIYIARFNETRSYFDQACYYAFYMAYIDLK